MKIFESNAVTPPEIEHLLQGALGGVDLGAWRQADGKYKLVLSEEIIDDFPETLPLFGHTYTLEYIEEGAVTDNGTWVNVIYV